MIWAGLALQAVVFAVWAWLAFRTLFRLAAWSRAQSGQTLPGPRWTLRGFGSFLRAPEFESDRRHLGLATLALAVIIAVNRLAGGPYG